MGLLPGTQNRENTRSTLYHGCCYRVGPDDNPFSGISSGCYPLRQVARSQRNVRDHRGSAQTRDGEQSERGHALRAKGFVARRREQLPGVHEPLREARRPSLGFETTDEASLMTGQEIGA